jgi:hypothetical protein
MESLFLQNIVSSYNGAEIVYLMIFESKLLKTILTA